MFECFHISSSTLYGVTKPVTEVTKLVTHEESLTLERGKKAESHAEPRSSRRRRGDGEQRTEDRGQRSEDGGTRRAQRSEVGSGERSASVFSVFRVQGRCGR